MSSDFTLVCKDYLSTDIRETLRGATTRIETSHALWFPETEYFGPSGNFIVYSGDHECGCIVYVPHRFRIT